MTSVSLHAPPRWEAVVTEQVRSVGLVLRDGGALLAAVFGALSTLAIFLANDARVVGSLQPNDVISLDLSYRPEMSIVVALIGLVLPFVVWQEEDPARRLYHWSMPVSRDAHALAKIFAGWFWLMGMTALFLGTVALTSHVVVRLLGIPASTEDISPWVWLVPFGSATIGYGLVSALAVGCRRPLVPVVAVCASYQMLLFAVGALNRPAALRNATALVFGDLGLMSTLAGRIPLDVYGTTSVPSWWAWLAQMTLWGLASAALLWWAVSRHREPS